MRGIQFSMISNNATTGFKLQGATVDNLLVKQWSSNTPNWEYVLLSRVRELTGLFLQHPVSNDPSYYSLNPRLLLMLNKFHDVTCPPLNMSILQIT